MEGLSVVADDSIEFEAKHKDDSSWYPCRISLSSSGDSLIVNFGRHELDDMLLKKDEVLIRLRFLSMPLQVDDCFHIEEGERVLVNRTLQSKNLFHDAEVEKVNRVRHSKRGCRCTFMIKWIDNDIEGQTLTVPSSSIMKVATKSISDHPMVHILLKPEKDPDSSNSSPLWTVLDDSDAEMDLSELLQKQIEQISNLADAPEKDFPDDILWRNKVLDKAQKTHSSTAESNARVLTVPDSDNDLKRITRSKTKPQVDIEAKHQLGTGSLVQEEFVQNRSHLSPLASRAALASSLLTAKKCLDKEFSFCMTADMLVKGKHSSEALAISIPLVSDASCKPSSCVPTKVWGYENKTSEKINCNAEDTTTSAPAKVKAGKITSEVAITDELAIAIGKKSSVLADINASSTDPMRLTRSAMRKEAMFPNECIQVKICPDNAKKRMSGNKNRMHHSTVRQEKENLANEKENNSTQTIDSGSSERNIVIPNSDVSATKSATSKMTKDASTPCKDAQSARSDHGKKRKAVHPNKQGRRISPRNQLPRTRSQNKSRAAK